MRLFVLSRHAESVLNIEDRVNGDPTVRAPLTDRGRGEAALLGLQIRGLPVDACLHTRFGRTLETAQIALTGRDVPTMAAPAAARGAGSFRKARQRSPKKTKARRSAPYPPTT